MGGMGFFDPGLTRPVREALAQELRDEADSTEPPRDELESASGPSTEAIACKEIAGAFRRLARRLDGR